MGNVKIFACILYHTSFPLFDMPHDHFQKKKIRLHPGLRVCKSKIFAFMFVCLCLFVFVVFFCLFFFVFFGGGGGGGG